MLNLKEAIVVEGIYDKIKLSQITDAVIITTDGFDIYKNKKKANLIKKFAKKDGIIILTDSDRAGFQIRNYVKNVASCGTVKHAYIPDISGKEKRKPIPSKEGFLGVEGISDEIIKNALIKSGATVKTQNQRKITKSDLYADGLCGNPDSRILRQKLIKHLNLPARVSSNMLLDILNGLYTYEKYKEALEKCKK